MRRLFFVLALLSLAASSPAVAQEVFDLSVPSTDADDPVEVGPGELSIEIVNRLPGGVYDVKSVISQQREEPLKIPSQIDQSTSGPPTVSRECEDLNTLIHRLAEAKDEAEVAGITGQMHVLIRTCESPQHRDRAEAAISSTKFSRLVYAADMTYNSVLTVTIRRFEGEVVRRTWVKKYRAPRLGEWIASYGFAFAPNRDQHFFSKTQAGADSMFQVTRKIENQKYDFIPAVFYAFAPTRWRGNFWSHSVAAGLGFDLSNPVVFLGYSGSFAQNVSVVTGAVMRKTRVLNGKYHSGDIVAENLTEDQLSEQTYRPAWFIGLSFRFGSAPESHKSPNKVNGEKKQESKGGSAGSSKVPPSGGLGED